jgi:hypothetical protein
VILGRFFIFAPLASRGLDREGFAQELLGFREAAAQELESFLVGFCGRRVRAHGQDVALEVAEILEEFGHAHGADYVDWG